MYNAKFNELRANLEKVIVGKQTEIETVLAALLAGGHVLLEDVPGTGKTVLAKALSRSLGVNFARVQFTPDLLPSDIIGMNLYNPKEVEFRLKKGPVFTNILLADEINRATPRTQSALLESMEEEQVSIDGISYKLDAPYFVIATQNPIETQGTFPLPEAQLDRFLIRMSLGYPGEDETINVLLGNGGNPILNDLKVVMNKDALIQAMQFARNIHISYDLVKYITELIQATRKHPQVSLGVSVRGGLALLNVAKSRAAINGRNFVTPDDIQYLAPFVFLHRMLFRGGLRSNDHNILDEIIASVPVPVENWEGL